MSRLYRGVGAFIGMTFVKTGECRQVKTNEFFLCFVPGAVGEVSKHYNEEPTTGKFRIVIPVEGERAGWKRSPEERWTKGVPHDSRSKELYEFLALVDYANGDMFGFKSGGDGDNGDHMMYLLDMYFERKDEDK